MWMRVRGSARSVPTSTSRMHSAVSSPPCSPRVAAHAHSPPTATRAGAQGAQGAQSFGGTQYGRECPPPSGTKPPEGVTRYRTLRRVHTRYLLARNHAGDLRSRASGALPSHRLARTSSTVVLPRVLRGASRTGDGSQLQSGIRRRSARNYEGGCAPPDFRSHAGSVPHKGDRFGARACQ